MERILARVDKPGWRAFALSMVALALAFMLAMYSTIFAQQGRVVATAICAISALCLAAYVAFTAIPYLARRTHIEWLQVSLDYRVTREGWAFILLILILAVAGLNTGNNLLYLILSSLLAALLISGMLSLAVLNGVDLELEIPQHVFARRPVDASIILENLKKSFPSFSLTLRGTTSAGTVGAGQEGHRPPWRMVLPRAFVLGLTGGVLAAFAWLLLWKWTSNFFGLRLRSLVGIGLLSLLASFGMALMALAFRERKRQESMRRNLGSHQTEQEAAALGTLPSRGILEQPQYFPFLPRGGIIRRHVQLNFPRRGRYREEGFDLCTRFPFGFLEKTMHVGISRDLIVYPAVKPSERFMEILPRLTGEIETFQRGTGHDLYSIREMVGSDSVRHVDWKASARAGSMMVREFAREDERRVQLILDPRIGNLRGKARLEAIGQFEVAVEFCASLAWQFYELGTHFQFVCGKFTSRLTPASEVIYEIMEYLAEVDPSEESPNSPLPLTEDENVFRIICTCLAPDKSLLAQTQRTHLVLFSNLTPVR